MTAQITTRATIQQLLDDFEFADLSPQIHSNMPNWNSHPIVSVVNDARSHLKDGYFCQLLVMPEHTGSHVDAPHHVHADLPEKTIDAYPGNVLIRPAKKVDARSLDLQPGELLDLENFQRLAAAQAVEIHEDDVALVQFGYDRYLDESAYTSPVDYHWWAGNEPGFAEDLCAWLRDQKVRAVGTDTSGADAAVVNDVITAQFGHTTYFLPNDILIIEGLVGLSGVPSEFLFLAIPLNISHGSGSPLRVMGAFPRSKQPA